jgi:uncharacterized protein (DUF1330 family)
MRESAIARNRDQEEQDMAAYVIGDVKVKNPDIYAEYRKQVPATVQKYGGRFVVRGGAHERVEGTWDAQRIVVLEFPDLAAAKAWYHSEEYAPLIKLRQTASEGSIIIVEGA